MSLIIDAFNLRKLELSEGILRGPIIYELTFEKLDRIRASRDWELHFLHTVVQALTRGIFFSRLYRKACFSLGGNRV